MHSCTDLSFQEKPTVRAWQEARQLVTQTTSIDHLSVVIARLVALATGTNSLKLCHWIGFSQQAKQEWIWDRLQHKRGYLTA